VRHRKLRKAWRVTVVARAAVIATVASTAVAVMASTTGTESAKLTPYHWQQIPVGFTMADLQHHVLVPNSLAAIAVRARKAKAWGANTIRLQITQDRLVGEKGDRFDASYMHYIRQTVGFVGSLGMTVVLNAQTEYSPHFNANEPMPTHATHVFWRHMMALYANKRGVVFDLFNEPRYATWEQWRVKFQALVNFIRKHADNPIWLEGLHYASTLEDVPMLHGANLVYTFHHPVTPWAGMAESNSDSWRASFGYLAENGLPVVDAEFTDDAKTYHLPQPTRREYLTYAKIHHIGMIIFGLSHRLLREVQGSSIWILH